ncbi:MAG TPA: site-2 protease family protein [Streptosporangiaceae bacterium]|jgi:membrane-associated protease RseP (regulator of RpoE activity)|nr:site-2 protease family protein [Streptosporangiaceae bacterium]
MSFLLGVLIFVLALLFSIMLHEAGHFVTAKRFGMKVTQFFIGFGQTLWSRQKGETEYGVKAIPAGGYVKIVGMTEMEDVDPADEPRSFRRHPGWQRIIVLAAGSFMHFALAFVLLFALVVGIGLATVSNSTAVGAIDACVPATLTAGCTAADPASPARQVGIRPGDTVIAVAGTPVRNWTQMGRVLRSQRPGTPVTVTVERNGRRLTLHPSLAVIHGRQGSYLGISPVIAFQRAGPLAGISYAGSQFGQILAGSAKVVASLPRAIPDLFAKNRASTPGGQVTSVVGAGDVTGQVLASKIGWQPKVSLVLLIVASLNIFVGAFNLLPLLPLDGGHLAVVIYERVRAWLARLRGRPDPGPVDFRRLVPLSVGVFALLVGLGLLLIMADIVNPVHILQ